MEGYFSHIGSSFLCFFTTPVGRTFPPRRFPTKLINDFFFAGSLLLVFCSEDVCDELWETVLGADAVADGGDASAGGVSVDEAADSELLSFCKMTTFVILWNPIWNFGNVQVDSPVNQKYKFLAEEISLAYQASSDLGMLDFHLFLSLKKHFGGRRMYKDKGVRKEVTEYQEKKLAATFYESGIRNLKYSLKIASKFVVPSERFFNVCAIVAENSPSSESSETALAAA
ncbi:hypothetical protein J437_LFUL018392 [Ladona fulva]|uniref:Uncharacterized protein n=1 Tax=Ladona fulva TaxID=123851 RepID=A0A8K0PA30_LADFU|nr:hypothetical protein J437_LFUL018392 [Ladona fulva]